MDARLVARIQRKDHAAYDELVARYGDVLFSYIFLSMHDRQQSEALLGATLLRGIEQIDRYNPAGPAFLVWLYRIAQTVLRDSLTATPYKARVPQRAATRRRRIDGFFSSSSRAMVRISAHPRGVH